MEMREVESSNIAKVGYDATRQVLAVQFKSAGKVYHYENVPPELHDKLMASPSKGTFLRQNVIGRSEYPYTAHPITPEKPQ